MHTQTTFNKNLFWLSLVCFFLLLLLLCPQPSSLHGYETGVLENSPKMMVMMAILELSVAYGDRILIFRLVRTTQPVLWSHDHCLCGSAKVCQPFPSLRSSYPLE